MSRTISDSYPIKAFNGIGVNTSVPCSSANYYSYSSRIVKYIVIHYTGNSKDTAKANVSYFNSGSRGASAHYFVDENSCYQSVALNNAAWAVGGTKVYKHTECRNKNSVSIEMCCSGNYRVSDTTINNTAYLCAELCRYIGITADEVDTYVLRHYDVWNKSCPAQWVTGNGFSEFKEKVKAILNGNKEEIDVEELNELKERVTKLEEIVNMMNEPEMIYNYIDDNMPEWAREGVRYCVENGIIKGTGNGLGLDSKDLKYCTIIARIAKAFEENI